MGEPLDSEYSTPKCRRWARAWLDRPFRVSNQAPHSWHTMSLLGSTSNAAQMRKMGYEEMFYFRHLYNLCINQLGMNDTLTEVEWGISLLWSPEGFGREVRGGALHPSRLMVQTAQGGGHRQQGGDGGLPHHRRRGAGPDEGGGGRGGHRGGDGERDGFLVHVCVLISLLFPWGWQDVKGLLGDGGPGEGRGEVPIQTALLGDLVEEVDGCPAALRHADAQLAQVGTGVTR